jgi:hypothetical protein
MSESKNEIAPQEAATHEDSSGTGWLWFNHFAKPALTEASATTIVSGTEATNNG